MKVGAWIFYEKAKLGMKIVSVRQLFSKNMWGLAIVLVG